MKDRQKLFSETEVRNWCFQVFQGLAYMQQRGYFHRDLKPGAYFTSLSELDWYLLWTNMRQATFAICKHYFMCNNFVAG